MAQSSKAMCNSHSFLQQTYSSLKFEFSQIPLLSLPLSFVVYPFLCIVCEALNNYEPDYREKKWRQGLDLLQGLFESLIYLFYISILNHLSINQTDCGHELVTGCVGIKCCIFRESAWSRWQLFGNVSQYFQTILSSLFGPGG